MGALTREDVLPKWIVKLMGVRDPQFTNVVERVHSGEQLEPWVWDSTNNLGHRYQVVCFVCNRTWMSAMETRARGLLGSLIFDPLAVRTFSLDDQRFIASWATKVHLMYRYGMNPGDRPSESEMRGFHASRAPTADTITNIASWVGAPTHAFIDLRAQRQRLHFARNSADQGQDLTVTSLTIRIGHLVIQNTVVVPPQKGGVVAVNLRSDFRQSAVPIHPPIGLMVSWPPARRLDDASFEAFAASYDVPWKDWPLTG